VQAVIERTTAAQVLRESLGHEARRRESLGELATVGVDKLVLEHLFPEQWRDAARHGAVPIVEEVRTQGPRGARLAWEHVATHLRCHQDVDAGREIDLCDARDVAQHFLGMFELGVDIAVAQGPDPHELAGAERIVGRALKQADPLQIARRDRQELDGLRQLLAAEAGGVIPVRAEQRRHEVQQAVGRAPEVAVGRDLQLAKQLARLQAPHEPRRALQLWFLRRRSFFLGRRGRGAGRLGFRERRRRGLGRRSRFRRRDPAQPDHGDHGQEHRSHGQQPQRPDGDVRRPAPEPTHSALNRTCRRPPVCAGPFICGRRFSDGGAASISP
jgi:hypothetical protein